MSQEHCSEAIRALQCISAHWFQQLSVLALTEGNAEVLATGAVSVLGF